MGSKTGEGAAESRFLKIQDDTYSRMANIIINILQIYFEPTVCYFWQICASSCWVVCRCVVRSSWCKNYCFQSWSKFPGLPSRVSRLPACWRWWRPWWTRSAWWPCPACTPASARPCASRKGRDPEEEGTIEDKWYIFLSFNLYILSQAKLPHFEVVPPAQYQRKKRKTENF